ncbi:pilus assembly protein [Duganella lactea]|uniref:pilus assembly protein n=1 Tax=Duganella lactea TaxID=2692173 RepID=UPI001927FA4F|nr:PilC/PilY family type IV pilus protein [Duganella lactea]
MKKIVMMALVSCVASASLAQVKIDSLPVVAACKTGKANGPVLLDSGDLYQAAINIGDWGGHFSRYVLAPGATGGASGKLAWDAGAILTGSADSPPMPTPALRQIYTAVIQPDGALDMVPFVWPSLSSAQQALLNAGGGVGEQRVAYLRGERSLEGAPFRRRSSVLGDAVHSTPVYNSQPGKRAAVYLGANDGMLHAFDAITGIELFAYVPDALIAHLHQLSNPAYVHRAYVDGPASISGGTLVSAMGGGATGVFALDVADPARFAEGRGVLWEFTGRDDPLIGNVITPPHIANVRVSKDVYRRFAVVANGLNAHDGALFLLALDKPRGEGWLLNANYYRIKTHPGALSAPVLLNDSDGVLRYGYAGDLDGNLWRFDFSGGAPWAVDKLFAARDASGKHQPITEMPLLAYGRDGVYMILFGTGQLIETADRASTSQQSYYALIDNLHDVISGRSQLTRRFMDGGDLAMEPGSKGWFIDFTEPRERSTQAGILADGAVLFNTVLPGADLCSPTRSRSYALSVLSGLPDDGNFIARLPGGEAMVGAMLPDYAPSPLLLSPAMAVSTRDALGRIRQEKNYAVAQIGAGGLIVAAGSVKATRRVGRLSWREIANWRELHEAAK